MAELKSFDSLMIVHAEDSHAIDRAPHPGGDHYATFLASRPRGAENKAIAEVIERARWTGARAHILHLSSSDALPMIASRQARRRQAHRGDVPALPDPDGRGNPRRRHRVQVLPAHPRGLQPRAALAGPAGRHHRLHRLGPLPLHPGPQGPGKRRLRRGLGRRLVAAAGPVPDLDRGPAPRHPAGAGGVLDGREARRPGPPVQQGPAGAGLRRRLRGLRPGRGLRGGRLQAQAQEPHHALRRQGPLRRGPQDLPARRRGGRPDPRRQAASAAAASRARAMAVQVHAPRGNPRARRAPGSPCSRQQRRSRPAAWPSGWSRPRHQPRTDGAAPPNWCWPVPCRLLRRRKSTGPPPERPRPACSADRGGDRSRLLSGSGTPRAVRRPFPDDCPGSTGRRRRPTCRRRPGRSARGRGPRRRTRSCWTACRCR